MLKTGTSNIVRFNVDVHGTKVEPKVRLVISADHELGFAAYVDGDKWRADVDIPAELEPGQYDMRVEVTLNNRLFTPIKRKVTIERPGATAPEVQNQPVEDTVDDFTPDVPNNAARELFRQIMASEGQTPPAPTQLPDQTHEWEGEGGALPEKKEEPLPLPPHPKVRINIAEIVAESELRFEKVLKESKPALKKPVVNRVLTKTPVSLKKGGVVYE